MRQCTISDPITAAMVGLCEILEWDAGQNGPAYFPDLAYMRIPAKSPSSTSGPWTAWSATRCWNPVLNRPLITAESLKIVHMQNFVPWLNLAAITS